MMMPGTEEKEPLNGITLLGLGPGATGLVTREAWEWLGSIRTLTLRTVHHPTVSSLPKHLSIKSFDDLYEAEASFDGVYERIVETVVEMGKEPGGVTYAVPGHPYVAEATCPEIARRAKAEGIPLRVIDGLSFLEPTFTLLELDPFDGLALVDAIELSTRLTAIFPPTLPALVAQIYSRQVASDVKLTLMTAFPDEHPVRLVHQAGGENALIEDLPLYELDHSPHLGLLSSLYIPPLSEYASMESFQEVIVRLRAPDGCPWDREQTHLSLRPFLLEEAYEALDALDREDPQALKEELGDLLLQIVLHAQIATESGDFNLQQVLEGIGTKLVRRHPHVFSEVKVDGVAGVTRNWEAIKAAEREEHGDLENGGLLDGIPRALPALIQADQVIERARRVGFDEVDNRAAPGILYALIDRIKTAGKEEKPDLFGELLMGLSTLANAAGVDAESALRASLANFRARFAWMEKHASDAGKSLQQLSEAEMDQLWAESEAGMR